MRPLPIDQLLSNPQKYPDQYPPIQLQALRNTEWSPLVPIITARMANDISELCQASPARTYAYNLLSENGWNNTEFRDAVGVAFVFLEFFARVMQNPLDSVIDQSIQLAGRTVVATQIRDSQQLASYCSPDILNASQQALQTFQEANTKLQNVLNQEQARNGYTPVLPLNPFSSYVPQQAVSSGWGNNYSPPHVPTFQASRATMGQANMFQQENDTARLVQSSSRYAAHAAAAKAIVTPAPAPAAPANIIPHPNVPPTKVLQWEGSDIQPYRPWNDPFLEKKELKEEYTPSGNKCVVEHIVTLEREEMRKEQHELPLHGYTASIPSGQGVAMATALKEAQELAMQKREAEEILAGLNDKSEDIRSSDVQDDTDDFPWITGIDQLVFQTLIKGARNDSNTARGWGSVPNYVPFISGQKEKVAEWFKLLRAAKSLDELALAFMEVRKHPINSSVKYPKAIYGAAEFFFRRLEKQVTQAINDVLTIQMSLGVTIDEFSIDYGELIAHIEKTYSKKYVEIFLSTEESLLNRFQAQFEGDSAEVISIYTSEQPEANAGLYIDGTVDNYSVTVLPYTAADLGLHKLTNAVLVTQSRQPALHLLIKNTMTTAKKTGLPYTAHYLVMLCGARLRMHQGLLTAESYLISP